MKELMQSADVKASEDVQIDAIGDTKRGEAKGSMDFPRSAANVAKKIMGQQLFKGLPKRWKGHGDYFFEQEDDGSLKITGGDKANSLTGGKSVKITDTVKIKEILEKARSGDILEENVSYKAEEQDALYDKEELGKMMRGPEEPAEYSESSLKEMVQNVREPLYDSKEELAKMVVGKPEPEEDSLGVSDMKETEGRPTRTVGHDVMGKVQDLLTRTAQEAEQIGDSETVAKLKSVLQMLGIG